MNKIFFSRISNGVLPNLRKRGGIRLRPKGYGGTRKGRRAT